MHACGHTGPDRNATEAPVKMRPRCAQYASACFAARAVGRQHENGRWAVIVYGGANTRGATAVANDGGWVGVRWPRCSSQSNYCNRSQRLKAVDTRAREHDVFIRSDRHRRARSLRWRWRACSARDRSNENMSAMYYIVNDETAEWRLVGRRIICDDCVALGRYSPLCRFVCLSNISIASSICKCNTKIRI